MLTSYGDNGMIVRSLAAGAKGYVMKDVELTDLKQMIRSVSRGNSVLDPKIATTSSRRPSAGAPRPGARGQPRPRCPTSTRRSAATWRGD